MEKNNTIEEINSTAKKIDSNDDVSLNTNPYQKPREPIIVVQKRSDYEEKSKRVDLLELIKSNTKDIENITKEQSEILMSNTNAHFFMDVNDEEIKIENLSIIEATLIADRLITNSEKTCDPKELDVNMMELIYTPTYSGTGRTYYKHDSTKKEDMIKQLNETCNTRQVRRKKEREKSKIENAFNYARGLGLTEHISIQSMEDLEAYNIQGKLISVKPFESENVQPEVIKIIDRGQSYERIIEELLHKVPEIKMIEPDYTESKKVPIPLTGEIAEPDVKIANEIMENLSFSDTLNLISPNHVFGNVQIDEQSLNERIFNNNRMLNNLRNSNESSDSKPIEKPFYEEKFIPTEQEFKKEAQAIKSNYPNLGTAQNELAKIYGLKDYRAIKSCFPKSNDEIQTFIFNAYKLTEQELEEFNRLTWKFRVILRELNIGVGLLNQFNAFDEANTRLYYKESQHLLIQENSLMMLYRYFLTENSILFGQIKRNIKRLSQDEKLYILKDLESLQIDKNDETVFGLFVNLLAYHIGKSAGDVTLHKNEDGTIEQRFVPKSSSPGIENALINILSNKELKIDSDDNIKVNISSNEILDSMGISQSKEKGFNLAKETLKKFGLKPNEDGDYE